MTRNFLESRKSKINLFKTYVKILSSVLSSLRLDPKDFTVHPQALSVVYSETCSDMNALLMRRPLKSGISVGKVVGALVFRLVKSPHVFTTCNQNVIDSKIMQGLFIDVAMALGFEMVGSTYQLWPEFIIRELKYFLAKRHANQESLGICFDTFANSIPKQTINS